MTSRLLLRSLPAWVGFLACVFTVSFAQLAPPTASDPVFEESMRHGQQALAAHKYGEAIKAFEEANKRQQKKCAACYVWMATAYLSVGDFARGLESCDRAISYTNDNALLAQAHSLKGDALLALATQEPKKLGQAENEFRTAVQQDKDVAVYHLRLGVALLRESRDAEGLLEVQSYLALAPEGSYAQLARKLLANPDRARKNYAPDFRLTTLQGQTLSLDQLGGRVVVLDFWATWCHPCVESVPDLKELTKKYAAQGLLLISVSADEDEQAWRQFIQKKQMDWPQYWDSQGQIARTFGVRAFPTYIVIDDKGIIQQRIVGEDPQKSVAYRLRDALSVLPQLQATKKPE